MYNMGKIRGRIVEVYGTCVRFADALGVSLAYVSNRLTGKVDFSREDIEEWADALDISPAEVTEYFFSR